MNEHAVVENATRCQDPIAHHGGLEYAVCRRLRMIAVTLIALSTGFMSFSAAQDGVSDDESYRMPPQAIADLVDAPLTPAVSIDPDRTRLLLLAPETLPPIAELAQPELRIAGLRINPRTGGPSRGGHYVAMTLKQIEDGRETPITGLPEGARIREVDWSPDGAHVAFTITHDDRIELWAADAGTGEARRLTEARLNALSGSTFEWLPDSRALIVKLIPSDRGPEPSLPSVPGGPVVQQNLGSAAPARTYQDLLKNPHDEDLFAHHGATQVARIDLDGNTSKLGSPAIITRATPSPDGKYLLTETIHEPFSYLVPAYRFPRSIEVWDTEGKLVRQIADLPLAEEVPLGFDAVATGPRSVAWRADAPATLTWVEAQDGGDPAREVDVRDIVLTLAAPFDDEPTPLVSLPMRYSGIVWGNDDVALVRERWWRNRRLRSWIVQPGDPDAEAQVLFDRSFEDRYNDPGSPLTRPTPSGRRVLLLGVEGKSIYLVGGGASPEGDRPFLDKLDLASRETTRMFRSEAPYYEAPIDLVSLEPLKLLTRRESKREPPNFFLRDGLDAQPRQLTDFPHPTPQLADVQKELIRYPRADGVEMTATLYLPAGYSPADGPLPMLMWAYPREFKDAAAASQVRGSPHQFVRIRPTSPLLFLANGYAILDGPTMPIIGEGEQQPNDTYVEQLVASAEAAVDEVVRRGVADRNRIAIAGHSYGAFMTANLLAHSDLFAAGIARSGAFNRSLTPFGFQAEERTFWEAPEVYFSMSPFMHAEKINEPILLIHGAADNNSGTFPLQSERFYHALKGHGATARLVMLPHESHGYRARESIMHTLWETDTWLERYVKNRDVTGD